MIWYNPLFIKILLGALCIGISTGILGCFVILNKQSLLADTLAHATFPGICCMFLLFPYKDNIFLLAGALLFATLALTGISVFKHPFLKKETILGIILSSSFGLGTFLLSIIQKIPSSQQAGLNKFLLGHACTLLEQDLIALSILTALISIFVWVFFKEIIMITFDPLYTKTSGIQTRFIHTILLLLMLLAIIIGLQSVGLILITSFLIAPALAARQWTHSLRHMICISIAISMLCALIGTSMSFYYAHIPTGPMIVITATLVTFFSLFFGKFGIIRHRIYKKKERQ